MKNSENSYFVGKLYTLEVVLIQLLLNYMADAPEKTISSSQVALGNHITENLHRITFVIIYHIAGDEEKIIKKLLMYMERRRIHHEVWGIIPTDLRLPLTILSACITYLIVIIQFAHLYD